MSRSRLLALILAGALTSVTGDSSITLMNGDHFCSGRVEIFYNGQWGTVCDDSWDMSDAAVVCRQMGCGSALSVKGFGAGGGQIWLDEVECSGNELSLSECSHRPFGQNNCGHHEDAGVVCSQVVRLVNGSDSCCGRVEILHNGQWGSVCDDSWDMTDAAVVCRELGCGLAVSAPDKAAFGQGNGSIWLDDVECSGRERSLTECSHNGLGKHDCKPSDNAGVVCSGDLQRPTLSLISTQSFILPGDNIQFRCTTPTPRCNANAEFQLFINGSSISSQTNQSSVTFSLDNVDISHEGAYRCEYSYQNGSVKSPLSNTLNIKVGDFSIRLMKGDNVCSGRVEIFYNGQWGTVCSDYWDMKDAAVVCRQMGCGSALSAADGARFGQGSGQIWLDDVECSGNELSLSRCSQRPPGQHNCGRHEDAGVVCTQVVRLVSGSDSCCGRVEILHDGQWGSVCDDSWDMTDAAVVCKQLGCGSAISAPDKAAFGQGNGSIWLDDVECSGRERSLTECSHSGLGKHDCKPSDDAGVVCSGDLQRPTLTLMSTHSVVVPGGNIQFRCTTPKPRGNANAEFQLLINGSSISSKTHQSSVTFSLDNVDISHEGTYRCEYSYQNGSIKSPLSNTLNIVVDNSSIRLMNGDNVCSGRVEIFYNGQWGTVCGDAWDMSDAAVVCRQTGCGSALSVEKDSRFGPGSGQIWLDDVECSGNELSLSRCSHRPFGQHNCEHLEDAGVVCTQDNSSIRLMNGGNVCSGRVEIFYNDQWGTVCGDAWDMKEAAVVCRQMGCGSAVSALAGAHFGAGSGQIWLDDVRCSGDELSLSECSHRPFGQHNCEHHEDAGVVCSQAASLSLVIGAVGLTLLLLFSVLIIVLLLKRRQKRKKREGHLKCSFKKEPGNRNEEENDEAGYNNLELEENMDHHSKL